ncbi:conserved hypothetical protein [Verticillium alfalfae VaMs.102]|uniref:Uncharacterized protein n=1 Tax=Verticillium alfalfae (strain VaMs.102 / ATCC MYA-4576 / FGSC 10136) TaxID=526221 RepID=C9SM80_VERA1|nr:conserved hypothetical protein [Verticillium alfalfae VaMs.102]EEY19895.1 conserved hypothetical protein [Verticillium alfalfae VaMs.102]
MTAAARSSRLRPGGYQRVPEWELEQRQGQSQNPRQQRYQDTPAGPSDPYTGRQLPEKPLPALPPPSAPMLMSPGPGTTVGLAGRRRPRHDLLGGPRRMPSFAGPRAQARLGNATRAPPLWPVLPESLNGGTNNATIEVIIEQGGFNNSPGWLSQLSQCLEASSWDRGFAGLAVALPSERSVDTLLQSLIDTVADKNQPPLAFKGLSRDTIGPLRIRTLRRQCAHTRRRWCELFTYEEWLGFSYAVDLAFSGNNMFHNPTGRAVVLGSSKEVIARPKTHTLAIPGSQINTTLDSSEETFP